MPALRLLIAAGVALALADASIVTLALPPMLDDLDTTVEGVAAVIGVYTLVLARALPSPRGCAAWAGDRVLGVAGFGAFALAGVLLRGCPTTSAPHARVPRAAGARARRPRSSPASRSCAAAGSGSRPPCSAPRPGPALGGALTQAFDWRAIFLFQAPVAGRGRAASPPAAGVARAAGRSRQPAGDARPARRARRRRRRARRARGRLAPRSPACSSCSSCCSSPAGRSSRSRAAAAVSVLPLAALAGARIRGRAGDARERRLRARRRRRARARRAAGRAGRLDRRAADPRRRRHGHGAARARGRAAARSARRARPRGC